MTAQPSGAATPRDSDAHKRIAVPKAFCVLRERPRPRPKSGKVRRSDTLATQGFRNVRNAPRVVIPPPSETPPVSPCVPLCAILWRKPSVYPLSPVKANVGRLCEKLKNVMKNGLEDKIYGGSFTDFFSSADSEGSQRTGKCMYIKAWRNQGLQMRRSEQFRWRRKSPAVVRGREGHVFCRVCPCVRSFSESRVCTRFHPRKRTWAVCARS